MTNYGTGSDEDEAWRRARELAWEVYDITHHSEFEGDLNFINSFRRASFAIMASVEEGFERQGTDDFSRYMSNICEELGELRLCANVAYECRYMEAETYERIKQLTDGLSEVINRTYIQPDRAPQGVAYASLSKH